MTFKKQLIFFRTKSLDIAKLLKKNEEPIIYNFYKNSAICATYIYNRDKTNSLIYLDKVKDDSFKCLELYETTLEQGLTENTYMGLLNELKHNRDFLENINRVIPSYWVETSEEKKRKEIEENIRIYKENLLKVSCEYCNKCVKPKSLRSHYNSIACKKVRWAKGLPCPPF